MADFNVAFEGEMTDLQLSNLFDKRRVKHYVAPRLIRELEPVDEAVTDVSFPFDRLVETLRVERKRPMTWYIQGPGGYGKTSLIRELSYQLAVSPETTVPCVVDRYALARIPLDDSSNLKTVADLLEFVKHPEMEPSDWRDAVGSQKCVLLLDALNELEALFEERPFWPLIQHAVWGSHPFVVVVTSRSESDDDLERTAGRHVERLLLEEFSVADVREYIGANGLEPESALKRIHSSGIERAASHPLMLSLMVEFLKETASEPDSPLPKSRAQLIESVVMRSAKGRELPSSIHQQLTEQGLTLEAVHCAAAIASTVCRHVDVVWPAENNTPTELPNRNDLESILSSVWKGPPESRRKQIDGFLQTQLVDVRDDSSGAFEFVHPSFVASGLAFGISRLATADWPELVWHNRRFPGIAADLVGLSDTPDALAVWMADQWIERGRTYQILEILTASGGRLKETTERTLWHHIGAVFDPQERSKVSHRLVTAVNRLPKLLRQRAARFGIFQTLHRIDPVVAARWAQQLLSGHLGTVLPKLPNRESEKSPELTELVVEQPHEITTLRTDLQNRNPRTRGYAATRLGQLRAIEAADDLIKMLQSDAPINRGRAAHALGLIGSERAVDALCQVVANDDDPIVRGSAANALGLIGSECATTVLSRVFCCSDIPKDLANQLERALVRLEDASDLEDIKKQLDSTPSAQAENQGRIRAARRAGQILTQIGGHPKGEPLLSLLESIVGNIEEDQRLRCAAVTALGKSRQSRITGLLVGIALSESPQQVRVAAIQGLKDVGPSGIGRLFELIQQHQLDEELRPHAERALDAAGAFTQLSPPLPWAIQRFNDGFKPSRRELDDCKMAIHNLPLSEQRRILDAIEKHVAPTKESAVGQFWSQRDSYCSGHEQVQTELQRLLKEPQWLLAAFETQAKSRFASEQATATPPAPTLPTATPQSPPSQTTDQRPNEIHFYLVSKDKWRLRYGVRQIDIGPPKGCGFLYQLLSQPGQPIFATDLTGEARIDVDHRPQPKTEGNTRNVKKKLDQMWKELSLLNPEIAELKRNASKNAPDELSEKVSKLNEELNEEEIKKLIREIDQCQKYLDDSRSKKGKKKTFQHQSSARSAAHNVSEAIKKVLTRLLDNEFRDLKIHLEHCTSSAADSKAGKKMTQFIYAPDDGWQLRWILERPGSE